MPSARSMVSPFLWLRLRMPGLHWFSLCLGLFAAAVLRVIVVPGDYRPVQHDETVTKWDHQCQCFSVTAEELDAIRARHSHVTITHPKSIKVCLSP